MSTLRITNIEAKADPSSPTVDEKIKLTNSNGDILVHIDGKTSGITTIGINTTAGNIKFDQNSNVVVTGIITATKFVGIIEPTSLEIGSNIKLGNAGVITATSYVGDGSALTGIDATQIQTGNTSVQTVDTGSDGHVKINTEGTERLRITSDGRVGIGTDDPNSLGKLSVVVPTTGGAGAINVQNHARGSGLSNIVLRSLDNNGGNWADAEFRAEAYSFKIRTTERLRITSTARFGFNTANPPRDYCFHSGQADTNIQITNNTTGVDDSAGALIQQDGNDLYIWNKENSFMSLGTNAAERVRITSSGQFKVGGSSFVVESDGDISTNVRCHGHIELDSTGSFSSPKIKLYANTGNIELDGNLIMASGNGIDFSADANASGMSSEVLDDYEEGTWTPVINKAGVGGFASSPSTAVGYYRKVGKLLWISFYWYKSSGGFGNNAGAWYVSGLPFLLAHNSGGAYQFIPGGYNHINGTNYQTQSNRWQSNNVNGSATLTMYGPNSTTNWTSGYAEFSATGCLMVP